MSTLQMNLWTDPMYYTVPMMKMLAIAMLGDQLTGRGWKETIVTAPRFKGCARTMAPATCLLLPHNNPDTLRAKIEEAAHDESLPVALDVLSRNRQKDGVRAEHIVPWIKGRMVWSVTSQSVDPTPEDQVMTPLTERIENQ